MKTFIKKNLFYIICLLVATVLFVLGTVFVFCLILSCIVFGVVCILIGNKLRKKYKREEDSLTDENFFDARKYDYEEDVYYFGPKSNSFKGQSKNLFSKVSTFAPAIALYLLGAGLFAISISSLINLLF